MGPCSGEGVDAFASGGDGEGDGDGERWSLCGGGEVEPSDVVSNTGPGRDRSGSADPKITTVPTAAQRSGPGS